jgi:hypothetical protein
LIRGKRKRNFSEFAFKIKVKKCAFFAFDSWKEKEKEISQNLQQKRENKKNFAIYFSFSKHK